jgi:hypothetical protein
VKAKDFVCAGRWWVLIGVETWGLVVGLWSDVLCGVFLSSSMRNNGVFFDVDFVRYGGTLGVEC